MEFEPDDDLLAAAERVRLIRSKLDLTQKDVSSAAKIHQAQLSSIENGSASIPNRLLLFFAKKHSVNLNWIFTGDGDRFLKPVATVENDEGEMTFSGMQRAINELKNQRYENVRQVLNRRYLYRAGSQVDVRALSRNVPGGLIGISAPGPLGNHVEPLNTPDVTASAYQEEDRLSLSMDDLTGSTTGSTVNSNRRLQETATGMNLMAEAGNKIREMELRTFTETWIEPVLRQLVQLIAAYETDNTALTVAAKKAKLRKVLPQYFDHKFSVSVNVGMGAVSPTQRMQKIQTAVATVTQLLPSASFSLTSHNCLNFTTGRFCKRRYSDRLGAHK